MVSFSVIAVQETVPSYQVSDDELRPSVMGRILYHGLMYLVLVMVYRVEPN